MTGPGEPEPGPAFRSLAEGIRGRVLALAAESLPDLADGEVPASLRRFRSFAPAHRARLAARALSAALQQEPAFRAAVAGWLRDRHPRRVAAAEDLEPGAAPAGDAPAVAWLLGLPMAAELLEQARAAERTALLGAAAAAVREEDRRDLEEARLDRDRERAALRSLQLAHDGARREVTELRRRDRILRDEEQRTHAHWTRRLDAVVAERDAAVREGADLAAQLRQARAALAGAQGAAEALRRGEREVRRDADLRVRLLLDAIGAAARGLVRELALPPADTAPADRLGAGLAAPVDAFAGVSQRALDAADGALVEQLLRVPGAHLLVDGYNVTKTGYPGVSLAAQRTRLSTGLGALAARTGAEITCVFDGAERDPGDVPAVPSAARGIRVLFSPPGVIADEVLVRLVEAEPAGRALLVATSDREVGAAVRARGARLLASGALLAALPGTTAR